MVCHVLMRITNVKNKLVKERNYRSFGGKQLKIAIIDADLIGRNKHRFPNLVCLKLSGYHKAKGDSVELKLEYDNLDVYDKVYLSKVFTDTPVPDGVLDKPNVSYGGTGFYYDKAEPLPYEIEHTFPDYHLYDDWVNMNLESGKSRNEFKYYLDYSIGFMTRGCFRQCQFCVNKNYKKVSVHSPLDEFLDSDRKKICLLDDNFLGCPQWKEMLQQLHDTKKTFQFKQGLDERILTDEKCEMLFKSKYDDRYIFAFDNIADRDVIESKLKLIRKYTKKVPKFYCFTGFDRNDKWDYDFWVQDIIDLWERIRILMKYSCLPYVMRFNRYEESPYKGIYIQVTRWCNQPNMFWKKSFREFCELNQADHKTEGTLCSAMRYLTEFESEHPDIAKKYFNLRYEDERI